MNDYAEAIRTIAQRIVVEVHPLRILVFGSSAKDETWANAEEKHPNDIDLLVVMPEGTHRRHTAQSLYRKIRGVGVPFDIIVATPTDLEKHKDNPGLIYRDILAEGKEIYAV